MGREIEPPLFFFLKSRLDGYGDIFPFADKTTLFIKYAYFVYLYLKFGDGLLSRYVFYSTPLESMWMITQEGEVQSVIYTSPSYVLVDL